MACTRLGSVPRHLGRFPPPVLDGRLPEEGRAPSLFFAGSFFGFFEGTKKI
jgi:hypothetical protein